MIRARTRAFPTCSPGPRKPPAIGEAMSTIVPSDGFTPKTSLKVPARRFTGISWHPLVLATSAVRFGPYCTGAVTPPGKGAPISSWQWEHARQWTMWSTTTRGDGVGRSWTWRVSTLADIPSSSVWPQWLQLEGKWFTTWSGLSERNSVPLQPFWPPGFRHFTLERLCAGASPGHRLTGAFCCSGQDVVQGRISPRPAWPWSVPIPRRHPPIPVVDVSGSNDARQGLHIPCYGNETG